MKPIGSALPPRRDEKPIRLEAAHKQKPSESFSMEPFVKSDVGQRFMDLIEREQLPSDVRTTLEGALTGDMTAQSLLFQAMIDTWPRMQKCLGEIKRAVSNAPWKICPYIERGKEEADKEAIDRAEMVEAAFWDTKPDPTRSEISSEGMLGNLVYGYYTGHHVIETYWMRGRDGTLKPRSYKDVPPRFYGYPYESQEDDRLMFNPDGGYSLTNYEDFPPHHFLIAINKGHAGHPTVAAPMRALTQYWLAANFGLKWLLQFSQLYGTPFRWATYKDASDRVKVCQMMENIGSKGYGVFPEGTNLNFIETSKGAEQLPQKLLIEMADRQCEIFMLGQSLTSDVGSSGSRALGEVHEGVRQDVLEGVTEYVADIVNRQLFPSMISLNYGDEEMLPYIDAPFEQAKDEKAMAERDEILLRAGVQLPKQWFYDRHGVPMPEGDEETISQGSKEPTSTTSDDDEQRPDGEQGDPATGDKTPHETKAMHVQAREVTPEEKELVKEMSKAIERGIVDPDRINDVLLEEMRKGAEGE